MAAHRARRRLPAELVAEPRWVRHRAKRPLSASGRFASVTDQRTWSSLAEVDAKSFGDGLGFVLTGDGIACLDLDDALDATGRPLPWTRSLLRVLPRTWIEVSPSGRGLHVWGTVSEPSRGRRIQIGAGRVEVYSWGRFITVTRDPFGRPVHELAALDEVIAQLNEEAYADAGSSAQTLDPAAST